MTKRSKQDAPSAEDEAHPIDTVLFQWKMARSWDTPCPITENLINGNYTLEEYVDGFSKMYGINPIDYEKLREKK